MPCNNWTNEKTQSLEFWDSDSDKIVTAESSDLKLVYKEVNETLLKATKLVRFTVLYLNNYETQNVSLALNVFNDKTLVALKSMHQDETALFVETVTKMLQYCKRYRPN